LILAVPGRAGIATAAAAGLTPSCGPLQCRNATAIGPPPHIRPIPVPYKKPHQAGDRLKSCTPPGPLRTARSSCAACCKNCL
jgi:hypothetical protein